MFLCLIAPGRPLNEMMPARHRNFAKHFHFNEMTEVGMEIQML